MITILIMRTPVDYVSRVIGSTYSSRPVYDSGGAHVQFIVNRVMQLRAGDG